MENGYKYNLIYSMIILEDVDLKHGNDELIIFFFNLN